MTGNEDNGYNEENPKDELVEEIAEYISEKEEMDEFSNNGFLISDESDRNDPDSDIEVESLISKLEVENRI